MTQKFRTVRRSAWLNDWAADIGSSGKFRCLTGAVPADVAATQTGVLVAEIALPSTPLSTSSDGTITKAGTWSVNSLTSGLITYARMVDGSSVCHWQGTVSSATPRTSTASAGVGTNILTFASTAGIIGGLGVDGPGVPAGTAVLDVVDATTIRIDKVMTATAASGSEFVFGDVSGDCFINSAFVTAGGVLVEVTSFTIRSPGY